MFEQSCQRTEQISVYVFDINFFIMLAMTVVNNFGLIAKSLICKLKILICLLLQQLCSHICLATLIISCCLARAFGRPKGAKEQERINFAKYMCEPSCSSISVVSNFADKTFFHMTDEIGKLSSVCEGIHS